MVQLAEGVALRLEVWVVPPAIVSELRAQTLLCQLCVHLCRHFGPIHPPEYAWWGRWGFVIEGGRLHDCVQCQSVMTI